MAKQAAILRGNQREVHFANGTVIDVAPFQGVVTQWVGRDGGAFRSLRLPAEEDTSVDFRDAMEELGIREQETIHLDVTGSGGPRGFRSEAVQDRVVIRARTATEPAMQVVLYQDESGGLSWHLPDGFAANSNAPVKFRTAGAASFTIPTRTVAAQEVIHGERNPSHLRGPITKWGRKIFKVLVVPIASPLLARPVESIVAKVEARHRQNLVRGITAANYRTKVSTPFTDWPAVAGRRSLLIIHGIFSSTEGMLAQLPAAAMTDFCNYYENRVVSFDQITVSRSPEENARFLLETVKAGTAGGRIEFDVLCHSRGGIVARTLAERASAIVPGHNCDFRKVFFVATPNRGSALANPDHILDMLDVFTNLLTNFPDGPVMYSIEIFLAIIKLLAHSAERNLPGLAAMGAAGYIKEQLNRTDAPPLAEDYYAAAAADYEPDANADNGFLTGRFANYLVDHIFKEGEKTTLNDLVVPQEGVFGENGHPSFPIRNPLVFTKADRVWHSGFFERPETITRIQQHFEMQAEIITLSHSETHDSLLRPPKRDPGKRRRSRFRMRSGTGKSPKPPRPRSEEARSDTLSQALELKREPEIDFHEQVIEGETNELRVRLAEVTALSATDIQNLIRLVLPPGQIAVELFVTLNAPGFDIDPPRALKMIVGAERDPTREELRFRLTARQPGPVPVRRQISADFWLHNSIIGSVVHRTFVIPKDYSGPRPSDGSKSAFEFVIPRERREDCDFTIYVQAEDETGKPPFTVSIQSAIRGREYPLKRVGKLTLGDASKTIENYLDQIYSNQFARYPQESLSDEEFDRAAEKWQQEFNIALDALGRTLWAFLPEAFRTEYSKMAEEGWLPRSILVHSDEMVLPWELVVPHGTINGKFVVMEALGTAHILGRWTPGLGMKPQPQKLPVRKFCILNPKYSGDQSLDWSEDEATELKKQLPSAVLIDPATFANVVRTVVDADDIQFLHFSGHGEYDPVNADLSSLLLEDGRLDAALINGSRLAGAARPIVYLNACSVGATGMVVGRMGGFAANFLRGGCSGVIAPYWPINDKSAMQFALALYRKLAAGRAVGEALQELRQDNPRDPSFRAFAYFGDPWTRTDLSSASAAS